MRDLRFTKMAVPWRRSQNPCNATFMSHYKQDMKPKRIIIDTDPGIDDSLAILLALAALVVLDETGVLAEILRNL